MTCTHCNRESADAAFCTFCGERQGGPAPGAVGRRDHSYAAHPGDRVAHVSVFTTLFPHLVHGRLDDFRWALLGGAGVVFVLYLLGLITAAIVAAAILVPLVYVMYLYEVRVYRDAPVKVVALTVGAGVVIGVVLTLVVDVISSTTPLIRSTPFGLAVNVSGLILFAIGVPLLQEIVKPIPALFLRGSRDFPETVDGLVFGVAAGLGFAAAETLIHFSRVITSLPVRTASADWIYPLVTITILLPLLHGTTTGIIAGALWRLGTKRFDGFAAGVIAVAVIARIAFGLGTELAGALVYPAIVAVAWQAIVVGALLIGARVLLHRALLEEAGDLGLAEVVCANCGSRGLAAGFCPVCGMAHSASPRTTGRGRTADKPALRTGGA